ncbi:gephyrin-like molybdotransferase Glp [Chloroflexota bacterium]
MPEFLKLIPPKIALSLMEDALGTVKKANKMILTEESFGYVAADDIISPHSLPTFFRSTVDGYAVRSSDTFGSSNTMPSIFEIIGEVSMGASTQEELKAGEVVIIHTGGMLPKKSDAVVMVEDSERINEKEVEVYKAVSHGENVLNPGEDVKAGEIVIKSGTMIRSAEIAGLMALGIVSIPVVKKPRIAIISSGDEIVPPNMEIKDGLVRDVNSSMLSSLISQWGGTPVKYGIIPDNIDELMSVSKKAISECDMVVFTAGSSVSIRDITADAISSLGKPGVIVHGVNIRPGKPTILAVCNGKPTIGLPGNPVSAYVTSSIFVKNTIHQLLGLEIPFFEEGVKAILETNIPSKAGREDWVPIKLKKSPHGFLAVPIFSRSNFIFSLVSADGLLQIPSDMTGLDAGEEVRIKTI